MDFAYTAEDEAFRAELPTWLDENLPKFLAEWSDDDSPEAEADAAAAPAAAASWRTMERRRAWQRKLNEGRWAAINWPTEWGGREADRHPERHLLRGRWPGTARRASTTPTASGRSGR